MITLDLKTRNLAFLNQAIDKTTINQITNSLNNFWKYNSIIIVKFFYDA